MNYISTRGVTFSKYKSFSEVTMEGLASDGGLFVPVSIPKFTNKEIKELSSLSYIDLCVKIITKYTDKNFPENVLKEVAVESYQNFSNGNIAPLIELEDSLYMLELYHGPTLAFKDFAMQFISRVFSRILNNNKITILGATSGDTGSAAIEALKDNKMVNVFILHPKGKISEFQRKQMTTVVSKNIFNIAINGNFDDCQALVKKLFVNDSFNKEFNLSSINSINWCRVLAQVVYYFYSALQLLKHNKMINFSVPTGNFGDAYAGYIAKQMGLPINKIIIATNSNKILSDFFNTGVYKISEVISTISPSMDIQVASNFERLLFEAVGHDPKIVVKYMNELKNNGFFKVNEDILDELKETFVGKSVKDDMTVKRIKDTYQKYKRIIDPHTAVGLEASFHSHIEGPQIVLGTASPVKFSKAVENALGRLLKFPNSYNKIMESNERFYNLDNNSNLLKNFISKNLVK